MLKRQTSLAEKVTKQKMFSMINYVLTHLISALRLPVDLVSGFNIATVNHDSRIDWLEVRITPLICIVLSSPVKPFGHPITCVLRQLNYSSSMHLE